MTETATLLADVFPAEVVLPGQLVERRVRVFIFDDGVVVYGDRGGVPTKLFAARHRDQPELPPRGTSRLRWRATVHTTEGDIHINRTGGCGCHSSLPQLLADEVRM